MGFLLLPANWNEDGVSPYWKVKPLPAKICAGKAMEWKFCGPDARSGGAFGLMTVITVEAHVHSHHVDVAGRFSAAMQNDMSSPIGRCIR